MAMLIYECLDGIENKYDLPTAGAFIDSLPSSLKEAKKLAAKSDFVNKVFSKELIEAYCG